MSGALCGVQDGYLVEATTVLVREALHEACPGPGDEAALKVHTVRAGGGGAPVQEHGRPAGAHDRRHLTSEESWRGDGRLADLADASLARLRAGDAPGGRCVIRRQDTGQPQVDDVARGPVTGAFCPGADGDALLVDALLRRDGQALEAAVHVGPGQERVPGRRVGVHTPNGSGCFRTQLPPRIGPRQVADGDRVRWEVARSLRLEKAVHRRDALAAEPPDSLKTLWQAARLAATIAALRAPTHHVHTRPPCPLGVWRCSWPCPGRRARRHLRCRGSPPRRVGTRSPRGSRSAGETPTGAVGLPSSIHYAAGNASPVHARRPTAGPSVVVM